jgi:threonine dehydrogenase-like Zn-dependent dehydrogenase
MPCLLSSFENQRYRTSGVALDERKSERVRAETAALQRMSHYRHIVTPGAQGTGWFAAAAANVKPGKTVVVVGDGAVGLLGVLSAKQMGAERIIAMSVHESRQKLAREFSKEAPLRKRKLETSA